MYSILRLAWWPVSWWRGDEEADKAVLPVDVRISNWISNNSIWATIFSVTAIFPPFKPRARVLRGAFRFVLVVAVVDLLFRGKGAAELQCDAYRARVQAVLNPKDEQEVETTYLEVKQLCGGDAWIELNAVCKDMGVENPFKIADQYGHIAGTNHADAESQTATIELAKEAMKDWSNMKVEVTWGKRVLNSLKLIPSYWLTQFWK